MLKYFFVFIVLISYQLYGQGLQYTTPEKLPSTVNTPFEDTMPMLSAGGDTLYFTTVKHSRQQQDTTSKGHDIWYSVRKDGAWTTAKNDLLNLGQFNGVVGIGSLGQTLYLLRYQDESGSGTATAGIAYSVKNRNGWQVPQRLNFRDVFTNNTFFGFFMHSSEQLLLISMRGLNSMGKEDLYVSFKDENNRWTLPKHLGPVVNSRGFEISPFLSEDGTTLYFASNGHEGFGNADIFMSERLDDSWVNWSTPKNLGKPINSSAFDAYFVQGKKDEVFFVSNRGTSLADIYYSSLTSPEADLLAENRKNNGTQGSLDGENKTYNAGSNEGGEENGEGNTSGAVSDATQNNQNGTSDAEDRVNAKNPNSGLGGNVKSPKMLTASSIYFDFNSDELTDRAKYTLTETARELKEYGDIFIELVGYTDNVGSQRYNLKLSRKRAKAVQDFLVANGIDKDLISTEGRGILDISERSTEEEMRRLQRKVDITYSVTSQ